MRNENKNYITLYNLLDSHYNEKQYLESCEDYGYSLDKQTCIDKIQQLTNNKAQFHCSGGTSLQDFEVYHYIDENNKLHCYKIISSVLKVINL
jgi:hypothetical protein